MKRILCFGDSNTWGFIPNSGKRYDKNSRWTSLLQKLLGADYEIIEEGCCNRTCFIDNPDGFNQTGCKFINEYLKNTANWADLIILSLGINDIQKFFNPTLAEIKAGLEKIIKIIKSNCPETKILLISPSKLTDSILKGYFKIQFDENSIEKSKYLGEIYEKTALENDCLFLDFDKIADVSKEDGLHYSLESHKKIAHALYDFLLSVL